jgi:hypothetical protein
MTDEEQVYHFSDDGDDRIKVLYWTAALDAACMSARAKLDNMGVGDLYGDKVADAIMDAVQVISPPSTVNFTAQECKIILRALALYREESAHPDEVEATLIKFRQTQKGKQ